MDTGETTTLPSSTAMCLLARARVVASVDSGHGHRQRLQTAPGACTDAGAWLHTDLEPRLPGSMPHAHLKMALPAAVTGLTDGGAWPDAIIVSRPLPGLGAPAGSAREPPRSPSVLRSAASKCRLCHAPHATAHPTNRAKPTPRAQAGLLAPGAPGACGGVAPVPGAGGGGARCPARGLLWCIVELVPLVSAPSSSLLGS